MGESCIGADVRSNEEGCLKWNIPRPFSVKIDMRTIETDIQVDVSHNIFGQVPEDILPGIYHTTFLLDEKKEEKKAKKGRFDNFPVDSLGGWPEGFSMRREDLYDDNGR